MSTKVYAKIPPQRLAFIGLGVMGFPMAGHLAKAGHQVVVYNRSPEKSKKWLQDHAGLDVAMALSPREAALSADVVFACVGNDDDLRSIFLGESGALLGLREGSLFVDHTTTSAQVARELHRLARDQRIGFVDAPVSGGQLGAETGNLTIMCGGLKEDFMTIEAVCMAYAKACTYIGESGSGQLAKMVNQVCIVGVLQGLSEALSFGKKAGLDLELVLGVIGKGAAQSWQLEHRGPTMIQGQFNFGFAVDWMRKDLGIVLDEAKRNHSSMPLTALVDQFYAEIQNLGGNRWDTSSLIKKLS
ncbi:MAG: NAD(P)-dependent oxidoreductase [Gammaproteobacteria bacterium]|nr:NAD(P)-dependent oxidoreductase [Gammaproteobacteria bacterium]